MTWEIVVFILLGLIAAPCVLAAVFMKNSEDRSMAIIGAGTLSALAVIVLVIGSFTIVGTREIGVVTTFGRPTGELPNGLHFKAPWSKVTEMDGAIQINTHTGDDAPLVRLANNSMARVDNSVQWRLKPNAIEQLFLDYRNFDNIRENLVTRQLTTALNEAFETVDPLSEAHSDGIDTTQMGEKVAAMLRERVGEHVEIINVLTPVIHYDEATQKRVDAFNVEATVRAWGDDATDDQALWTDVQLLHWANQWEAEGNAAAQREAMVEELAERLCDANYGVLAWSMTTPMVRANHLSMARALIQDGWKKVTDE